METNRRACRQHAFKLQKSRLKALSGLTTEKKADPFDFRTYLSPYQAIRSGEYVCGTSGENATGHFGLAVKDYTHSTAPNRRYRIWSLNACSKQQSTQDQRLTTWWASRSGNSLHETRECSWKVERQVGKSAAGFFLNLESESSSILWLRVIYERYLVRLLNCDWRKAKNRDQGVDVGDRIRVQLLSVDVSKALLILVGWRIMRSRGQPFRPSNLCLRYLRLGRRKSPWKVWSPSTSIPVLKGIWK